MKNTRLLHRHRPLFLTLALGWLLSAPGLPAQPASTGVVTGRVYNPATQEYVRNAEVQIKGTALATVTGSDGSFSLTNVAAGDATVLVSYTGYDTASVSVNVAPGAVATTEVNLTSPLYRAESAGDGTVKLDKFVVSTEREGNAKAIMDQRQAMTVSNIVASDSLGDIAGGNVGEFLKYLPGIQMD